MGRLSIISGSSISLLNYPDAATISTGQTYPLNIFDASTGINIISGITLSDIHIFIDEYGNVTQIKKEEKSRLKYCPDPKYPQTDLIDNCVIGVSDEWAGECSDGTAMGVGDFLMAYAKYL